MNRLALATAGTIATALLGATPVGAATLPPPTGGTTVTCGASGLQSGLLTKVCAEVTGSTVQLYGQVGLAGPPSPGSPAPQPRQLDTVLTGSVGGSSIGVVHQPVLFVNRTAQVRGLIATVPCGATVHASFAVSSYPWPAVPVSLDLPFGC